VRFATLVLASTLCLIGEPGLAVTFTVTNSNNSGPGSFQQAILDANVSVGPDTIAFNIPGAGIHVLKISQLPTITANGLTVDGFTQPGAKPNTSAGADNAVRLIDLRGPGNYDTGAPFAGLWAIADAITIKGLIISNYPSSLIRIDGGSGHLISGNLLGMDSEGNVGTLQNSAVALSGPGCSIGGTQPQERNIIVGSQYLWAVSLGPGPGSRFQGNFLGVGPDGRTAFPNLQAGILAYSAGGLIGGSVSGAGNLISGNIGVGIFLGSDMTVEGNIIGTDLSGTILLPNDRGIYCEGCSRNQIGGPLPGQGNQIVGNGLGIEFLGGDSNVVQGNVIMGPPTNGGTGVFLGGTNHLVGGPGAGEANRIEEFVYGVLVYDSQSTGNRILSNVINRNEIGISFYNASCGPGISAGSTGNPNNCQSHPVLTRALASQDRTRLFVSGSQDSRLVAGRTELQFFQAGDDIFGRRFQDEGAVFLHDESVDAGYVAFRSVFGSSAPVAAGTYLNATATTSDGTSWFCPAIPVDSNVPPKVARAPEQFVLFGFGTVTLDGSGSFDPDGLPYGTAVSSFAWRQVGGPPVTPSSGSLPMLSFDPPQPASYDFNLTVSDGLDTDTATFIATVYVPLQILSSSALPQGRSGALYSSQLLSSGGVSPVQWSIVGGQLPPDVVLSPEGLLAGTPHGRGRYEFTAEASDRIGEIVRQAFSVDLGRMSIVVPPRQVQHAEAGSRVPS
jgi:hypothetical protein